MTNIKKYNGDDSMSLLKISEEFFKSNLFPNINSPAAAFAVTHYGHELGITPMVALQTMSIIKGKISMGAGVMLSLAKQGGVTIEILKETDTECEIEFTKDGAKYTCSFTIGDAKKAGLVKKDGAWEMYPKDLLFHRAITRGLRRVCPELILGLYTPEEIRSMPIMEVKSEPVVETEPEIISETRTPGPVDDESPPPIEQDNKEDDPISTELIKALHAAFSRTGLIEFRDEFKVYCADNGTLDDPKASFTTLKRSVAEGILENIEEATTEFLAMPKYHPLLKTRFAALKTEVKRTVLMKITCYITDLASLPKKLSDMSGDFLCDTFSLFLTVLKNQYHNKVVDDTTAKGVAVDDAVDKLNELGMDPKVVETAEIVGPDEKVENEPEFF